jgi:uncharacterized protein
MSKQFLAYCFLGLLAFSAVFASGQQQKDLKLFARATDFTGTLTAEELSALEAKLQAFEQATSTQLVVVVVPTVADESIEDVAYRVAETNGIGKKAKNNGVLLFIAKNDRRIRIEVGYGLEGVLPDILAGQIIRKEITPQFREGNYNGGINAGVDAIIAATKNEYKADDPAAGHSFVISPFVVILLVLLFLFLMRGRRRSLLGGLPLYGSGWGGFPRSGGGGWGGGFGGGGGGGFSGGGGSFGGGGASGGW